MGLSNSNPPTAQVKLLVSPKSGRIPWSLLSWLALGSGAILLTAVSLSGAKLIIDPYSPNWLKTAFPGLVNSFEAAPQTAEEIQAELRSQNITADQPIPWPQADNPKAWLYPILSPDGRTIRELWVYQVRGNRRQRVDQVSIRPMRESFITTPLVGTASQVASVDSKATLSSVRLISGQASGKSDPWLLLEGQRRYGNITMRYGQILSYQPQNQRLHRLLNWSSSAGQPPQWQTSSTGSDQLVINQTVGLRPSFLLYQLVPNDPPQLKEVSLYSSVYNSDLGTSLYEKALKLAQGAVWSHSLQMMESAKTAIGQDWSAGAQAQLDLIRLHAQRTKAQTEQTWSSQQQHILAYLIDGQWDQALKALEDQPAIYDATLKRLERDFDSLWRGVTTHLQVHPNDVSTQIWGAMLVASRQSPEAGEAWLKKRTSSNSTLERLQALGKPDGAVADTVPTSQVAAAPLPDTAGRYLSLIGQATAVSAPGNGWLRSQTLPNPLPGQTWYQIDVQLLQDSSGWGLLPGNLTAANFWAESLSLRRQAQLFNNNQLAGGITIHGVKGSSSRLSLLAIGPQVEGTTLVTASNSLRWLPTLPWQTAPALPAAVENTLADDTVPLTAPDPNGGMTDTIGQQLGLTAEQTAEVYPYLDYARLDINADLTPEHIFSVSPGVPAELSLPQGKTLIFSDSGNLLYSDVNQQHRLLAVMERNSKQPAMLLIDQGNRYSLLEL